MSRVYVTFPFDNFKTDESLITLAKKYNGEQSGSGLGPEGRDISFEFKTSKMARKGMLAFRNHLKTKYSSEYFNVEYSK